MRDIRRLKRVGKAVDEFLDHVMYARETRYVANDLTLAETRRLKRIGEAVEEFLDKVQ